MAQLGVTSTQAVRRPVIPFGDVPERMHEASAHNPARGKAQGRITSRGDDTRERARRRERSLEVERHQPRIHVDAFELNEAEVR